MTRREPSCVRLFVVFIAVGSILGALIGWFSFDGDEGV